MDLVAIYDNEIRPKLASYIPEIFSEFNPIDKGRYYQLICPDTRCRDPKAFIYKNSDRIQCNRTNNCKFSITIISHLNGGTYPNGKAYVDIIRKLCEMTGTPFPERPYSPEEIEKFEQREQKQKMLHDFQRIVSNALMDETLGKEARQYLENRGFFGTNLIKYGLGFYPSAQFIKKELAELGHLPEAIKQSGLYRDDWNGRITLPWKKNGNIGDYSAREITDSVEKNKKYLRMSSASGSDSSILFRLDECSTHEIVLVEGLFDALTLDAHGIKNAVALGRANLTESHIKHLQQSKTKVITLIPDNDSAGIDGMISSINKLLNHDITIYVVPPELLGNSKDVDEFTRKQSGKATQALLEKRIDGFRYHAQFIVNKYKKGDVWKDDERQNALAEALNFEEKTADINHRTLSIDFFWEEFINLTGIDQDTCNKFRKAIHDKKNDELKKKLIEDRKKTLEDGHKKITEFIVSGNPDNAIIELQKLANALDKQTNNLDDNLEKLMHPDSLDEMFDAFKNEIPSIETGYSITEDISFSFPSGAVSVIAGPTGGGKTTVLINSILGALEQNPDLVVYFFSYEEAAHHIRAKFINTYANLQLNNGNNRNAIYHFFNKGGEKNLDAFKYINSGIRKDFLTRMKEFDEQFIANGRLKIINKEMSFEELIDAIQYINQQNPSARMFVIDYAQQLEMQESGSNTPRYEELKTISTKLRKLAAEKGLAILMAAQFKREVDEESKMHKNAVADGHGIAKEAGIMYGIWNRSNNPDDDTKEEAIAIKILKGRNVREGDFVVMPFNGNTGRIANTKPKETKVGGVYNASANLAKQSTQNQSTRQAQAFHQSKIVNDLTNR